MDAAAVHSRAPALQRRELDAWTPRESTRGGAIDLWGGYQAPPGETLRVPFEAFAVRERRCAHALLSASLALLTASRGSRAQLSEQLRDVRSAIDMLCESAPGRSDANERWHNLVTRFHVEDQLAVRGHEHGDAAAIGKRLIDARNVATHGADAALIDLGWPVGLDRQLRGRARALSKDLGFAALQADLSMRLFAVRFVLGKLWPIVRESGFDDSVFEQQFAP